MGRSNVVLVLVTFREAPDEAAKRPKRRREPHIAAQSGQESDEAVRRRGTILTMIPLSTLGPTRPFTIRLFEALIF